MVDLQSDPPMLPEEDLRFVFTALRVHPAEKPVKNRKKQNAAIVQA